MMEDTQKAILVGRIEPYMEKFTKFFKLGHIRLTDAESKEIASMMREINPRYNFNYKLNCSSCIREAVTSLSNFYSRERSKVEFPVTVETEVDNTPEEVEEEVTEEVTTEEIIKDEEYYNSLDKRTTEYKEWKASQTSE